MSAADLDMKRIGELWNLAVLIIGQRIPEYRAAHGVGSAVEAAVLEMLGDALECMTHAVALASVHPPTAAALDRRAQAVRTLIDDTEAELDAWREVDHLGAVAQAVDEAKGATLH